VPELTRRQLLKGSAAGAAAVSVSALGFDEAVAKATTVKQRLRIEGATVSHSVCPYCAVGCALLAYTRKGANGKAELLQIEGDPDSPVNEGRLCPKGASAMDLAVSRRRMEGPLYRAPGARDWKRISWDAALDKLARNIKAARDRLTSQGARVLGQGEPKIGAHGKPVLFLHPKDFCGTLVELEEA